MPIKLMPSALAILFLSGISLPACSDNQELVLNAIDRNISTLCGEPEYLSCLSTDIKITRQKCLAELEPIGNKCLDQTDVDALPVAENIKDMKSTEFREKMMLFASQLNQCIMGEHAKQYNQEYNQLNQCYGEKIKANSLPLD